MIHNFDASKYGFKLSDVVWKKGNLTIYDGIEEDNFSQRKVCTYIITFGDKNLVIIRDEPHIVEGYLIKEIRNNKLNKLGI